MFTLNLLVIASERRYSERIQTPVTVGLYTE